MWQKYGSLLSVDKVQLTMSEILVWNKSPTGAYFQS